MITTVLIAMEFKHLRCSHRWLPHIERLLFAQLYVG